MTRQRRKATTNEFYRSVLDNGTLFNIYILPSLISLALREKWKVSKERSQEKAMRQSRLLSSLYGKFSQNDCLFRNIIVDIGYSVSSEVVKDRLKSQNKKTGVEWFSPRYNVKAGLLGSDSIYSEKSVVGIMRESKSSPALIEPKKWYVGYNNSVVVPPGSCESAAGRYGYEGSLNIMRQHRGHNRTVNFGGTTLALNNSLPTLLPEEHLVDEYVDGLSGPPGQWPSHASYVTGSNLKAKHPIPKLCPEAKKKLHMEKQSMEQFNKSLIDARRSRALEYSQMMDSQSHVSISMHTMRPANEHNTILKQASSVKYMKSSTLLCESQGSQSDQSISEKKQQHHLAMLQLKWDEIRIFFKRLRIATNHVRPIQEEMKSILLNLKDNAIEIPAAESSSTILASKPFDIESDDESDDESELFSVAINRSVFITRDTFVHHLSSRGEMISRSAVNKIFSGFDVLRLGEIDYRVFAATLRCIYNNALETPAGKLLALFEIFNQQYDHGCIDERDTKAICNLCCISNEESLIMGQLFASTFRSTLTQTSTLSFEGHIHAHEYSKIIEDPSSQFVKEFCEQLNRRLSSPLSSKRNI